MNCKRKAQPVKDNKIIILIFLIGFSILIIPVAEGYFLPKTHLELYVGNDLIIFGKVLASKTVDGFNQTPITSYEFEILQHIKGNTENRQITVFGLGSLNSTNQVDNQTILSEGQELLLFLNKQEDGDLFISPHSFPSDSKYPDSQFILPPLKLYKSGIPGSEIQCKSSLKLAFKYKNDFPICIKPETFEKLLKRQWIK